MWQQCYSARAWLSIGGAAAAGFLAAYVRGLPLREPSEITDQASVNLLLARSAGITGRITLTVARAAELALRKGDERISLAWLEQASRVLALAPRPA